MAARIRLRRVGKKHQPSYRIIVVDSRKDGLGDYIESLGHYNNLNKEKVLQINEERARYWLGTGALPSETVRSLFRKKGLIA